MVFLSLDVQDNTLSFIMEHPNITESELFEDLPEHLQTAVEDAVAWHG